MKNNYGEPLGISWTLDYKVAEFFAHRSTKGCIVTAVANKEDINLLYFGRSEAEAITLFVDVKDIEDISEKEYDFGSFHRYIKTDDFKNKYTA